MIPGEFLLAAGDIELNAGRATVTVKVANTGDRPIQVGSHYHFYETNDALSFDREATRGFRLNIAAGTAGPPCASNPVKSGRSSSWPTRANAACMAFKARSWDRWEGRADAAHRSRGVRRHVRPDHGRPRALGRHRAHLQVEADRTIYGEEVKSAAAR